MISPKVSIIVPVYNVENYIQKCVKSLTEQSLKDIEIILIDDESPDSCPKICDDFTRMDKRIKVIHKRNEGLGLARNSGINIAKGEYIAFCDSDDYVDDKMYETLYQFMEINSLDVAYCNYILDTNGKFNYKTGSPHKNMLFIGKQETRNFVLEMIGPNPNYPSDVKYMISSCMAMYSSKIIKNYSVRFMCERIVLSEDTLFNLDILVHATNIGYCSEQLYYYRYNPVSLSRTFNHEKAKTFTTLIEEVRKRLVKSFTLKEYKLHYYRFVFYIFRLLIKYEAIKNIDGERKKHIRERCSNSLLDDVYREYPYRAFPFGKRLFFVAMKRKWIRLLIIMSIVENYIRKNI